MEQKRLINIVLIIIAIILLSSVGYYIMAQRSASPNTDNSSNNPGASADKQPIALDNTNIGFDLPKGYAAFQQEGFEGGYGTMIFIGKEVRSGYYKYAPARIEIIPGVYDEQRKRSYKPSEYIDIAYEDQAKLPSANPTNTQLFGNKAVRYTVDADGSTNIIGYLRSGQSTKLNGEYLVKITSGTYGTSVEYDRNLFDTMVNSLKVSN